MPALPHWHHGGGRLHYGANRLPADAGHIMTPDRRPDCAEPNRPPDRGGDAVAASASNVSPGTLEQGSNGQTRSTSVARRLGWRGQWRQITTPNAPIALHQMIRVHSKPIVPPAGGAV